MVRLALFSLWAGSILLASSMAGEASATVGARRGQPLVDVQDPAILSLIESRGFAFGDVLGAPTARTTEDLSRASPAFRSIRNHIAKDVEALTIDMAASGRELQQAVRWNTGRVLNLDWLRSPHAQFRLVGIVNRQDRSDVADIARPRESCGEFRFIYRLSYRMRTGWLSRLAGDVPSVSRMPFNLNVVYERPRSAFRDCSWAARAAIPDRDFTGKDDLTGWLLSGLIDPARLRLKQIELNAQIARIPSEAEPELGGQAVYLMRVFRPVRTAGKLDLVPGTLENTPDLERIRQVAALRKELIAYIRANVLAIDRGVYEIPEKFLASRALTFSTFGSARLGNHPFSDLLKPTELRGVSLTKARLVRSTEGLLARLDNGSCMGCHQSGATAGFHFLGLDDDDALPHNRIKQGISPHYYAEIRRREAYIAALAAGREPNRFRPLSAAPGADWTGSGPAYIPANLANSCITEASAIHLASSWKCRAGTVCKAIAENNRLSVEFGQCVPADRRQISAGLACLAGRIETSSKPFNDRLDLSDSRNPSHGLDSDRYSCLTPRLGVPGGLNYRRCLPHDLAFDVFNDGRQPDEICGMGGGAPFDRCAATGDLSSCLEASIVRQNRQVCGRDRFCREDYICQALPDNLPNSEKVRKDWGYCSPTYFLFQMRLDGHPDPI